MGLNPAFYINRDIFELKSQSEDVLNALNADMFAELSEVFSYAKIEKKIKAIMIIGEGKAFCAGADINRLATLNAIEVDNLQKKDKRFLPNWSF